MRTAAVVAWFLTSAFAADWPLWRGPDAASPVAADGKIFLTSEDRDTFGIKAGRERLVLGTNTLGEPVTASMALVGDSVYLRGDKRLYKIAQAHSEK